MRAVAPCPVCRTAFSTTTWVPLSRGARHQERTPTWLCPSCSLGRTLASKTPLLQQYRSRVFGDHEHLELPEGPDGGAIEASATHAARVEARRLGDLAWALARSGPAGGLRVLHVGARDGDLLARIEGTGHVGLEPWGPWVSAARERGVDCRPLALEQLESEETFDVVLEQHLLEHLFDPIGHLAHVAARLASGGMAVIEVPNLLAAYGGLEDRFLQVCHPCVYTPRALVAACRRAGLVPIRLETAPSLRIFCRRGVATPTIPAGPSAHQIAESAVDHDLRIQVKRGLARAGATERMLELAARGYGICLTAAGRADLAIEIADACSREERWVDVVYWLRASLRDRQDPDVERALAKAELLRGRMRDTWHAHPRHAVRPHPEQQQLFGEIERRTRALPC